MTLATIPDALALDLRDYYLAAPPQGLSVPAASVVLRHGTAEVPSPRIAIIVGEPRRAARMDGTASVPVEIQYITSMDRVSPAAHQAAAAALDAWARGIRPARRRAVLHQRVYLHEILLLQPLSTIREEEREQQTAIRAEITVTLTA